MRNRILGHKRLLVPELWRARWVDLEAEISLNYKTKPCFASQDYTEIPHPVLNKTKPPETTTKQTTTTTSSSSSKHSLTVPNTMVPTHHLSPEFEAKGL